MIWQANPARLSEKGTVMFSNLLLAVAIVFIAGALMGTPEEIKRKSWVDYALTFALFGLIAILGLNVLT